MNGNHPSRGQHNGIAPPARDGRRGASGTNGPQLAYNPPNAATMTRAERFDDEKRRIIQSCFVKTDANGQLAESYITHIRVLEDAMYPQAPPPPTSPPENKKPRVIIVAVRNTGRVRVHKARENANGTFSIGKTWNMEDLAAVQSFTHVNPQTPEDIQQKEWAGDIGFIVTLGKPYYWEAGTAKEKEFFLASLVKIYRKYTQGKVPQFVGFSPREMDSILGLPGQSRSGSAGPRQGTPLGSSQTRSPNRPPASSPDLQNSQGRGPPGPPGSRNRPPTAGDDNQPRGPRSRPPTAGDDRQHAQQRPPPSQGQPPMPPYAQSRDPNRQPRPKPSMERDMRSVPSKDQMRPIPGQPSTFTPPQKLAAQSSRPDFSQARIGTPETTASGSSKGFVATPRQQSPSKTLGTEAVVGGDVDSANPNLTSYSTERWKAVGAAARGSSPRDLRPSTAQSVADSINSKTEESSGERQNSDFPERRRPPLLAPQSNSSQRSADAGQAEGHRQDLPSQQTSAQRPSGPSPGDGPQSDKHSVRMPGTFPPAPPTPEPSMESKTPQSASSLELGAKETDTSISQHTKESLSSVKTEDVAPNETGSQKTEPERPQTAESKEEDQRPGSSPMSKKQKPGELGNVLRRAANAYNAFKPRAGGGAERFLAAQKDTKDAAGAPDGITGVVPAPSLVRGVNQEAPRTEASERLPSEPEEPVAATKLPTEPPAVTVSRPPSGGPATEELIDETIERARSRSRSRSRSPANQKSRGTEEDGRRKRRRSNQHLRYLTTLGVDPTMLEGRGLEFEQLLSDFGWGDTSFQPKKIEDLESDLKRELARLEAGNWLHLMEHKDERVDAVQKLLDRAIDECDELDGLLTLYNVELSSLGDDIAFIEAQSQGLQVQTANQKLLQTELQNLVETISITPDQLEPLKRAPIGKVEGLQAIESSLLVLYKAMITIDPTIRQSAANDAKPRSDKASGIGNSELSNMRALQEKKDTYLKESAFFLQRLQQHMDITFGVAIMKIQDALSQGSKNELKLEVAVHDVGRNELWQYSPLLLFAKEIDLRSWERLIKMYQQRSGTVYQDEFRDNALAWRKVTRKPTGEETELLFTSQEKDNESLASAANAARKLTVKRSQTLARSLRSASGDKEEKRQKSQTGKLHPFEAFAGALDEMCPLVFTEQNFIVDFFHATSAENADFADAVAAAPPHSRRGTNLLAPKMFEADRGMAKRVQGVMEDLFAFWPQELQNLLDFAVRSDPLQGVGILYAVDRKLEDFEDTNQDFLTRTLQTLHARLSGLFSRFVDEQIRAIEDTKVKIKKRKGVISFIKTFPHFSAAIENMLPDRDSGDGYHFTENTGVRTMVDDAYQKINKAMFESLKVIAKESPAVMATQGQGDPEDKEALNYHILLIENMNHYMEEVDDRSDMVLRAWKEKAHEEFMEHMTLYVDAVIRRPLGKLLDFIESTESLLKNLGPGVPSTSLSSRSSHSRPLFRKLLANLDAKELRRGVDALKKRVDKHFGESDDPGLSRNLVAKVLRECEASYSAVVDRVCNVADAVYPPEGGEGRLRLEWGRDEVAAAFRR